MIHTTNGNGRCQLKLVSGAATRMTSGATALMNSDETAELLGRVDERTQATAKAVTELGNKIDSHDSRLGNVERAIESLSPVKKVVYGGITAILLAVLGAAMTIILSRQQDTKIIENAVNKAVQQSLVK